MIGSLERSPGLKKERAACLSQDGKQGGVGSTHRMKLKKMHWLIIFLSCDGRDLLAIFNHMIANRCFLCQGNREISVYLLARQ
jgi:hypothetical protein